MKYKVYFHKFKNVDKYNTWIGVFDLSNAQDLFRLNAIARVYTEKDPKFYFCMELID